MSARCVGVVPLDDSVVLRGRLALNPVRIERQAGAERQQHLFFRRWRDAETYT
jgi:hypothetical protein